MKRDYRDFVDDIYQAAANIKKFIQGMTQDEFTDDLKTVLAVAKSIEIMGEASKNIPEEIKRNYPDIPWRQMAGTRDKLTHHYFGLDLQILWYTASEVIPKLEKPLEKIPLDLTNQK